MLTAAAAAADAAGPAHHLEVQALDFAAVRQEVAMAAMVAEDDVEIAVDRGDHPDGDRLLSHARVGRARQHAGRKQIEQRLLEQPNAHQQRVLLPDRRGTRTDVEAYGPANDRGFVQDAHGAGRSRWLVSSARKLAA